MSSQRDDPRSPDALREHAAECPDCGSQEALLGEISELLEAAGRQAPPLDLPMASHLVMLRVGPELARRARRAYWRRTCRALLLALLPLPAVLAYDAYALRAIARIAELLLPQNLAIYLMDLMIAQAVLVLLLFAATYATVPILADRRPAGAALGRSAS